MFRGWIAFAVVTAALLWPPGSPARADDAAPPTGQPSKADVHAAMLRFNTGKQMIARGDYAHAIAEIEQAYELDPRSEHLYNLGVAYQNNAERDKAIDYYRRYLAAAPDGKLVADAERYLAWLEAEAATEKSAAAQAEATAAVAEAMTARANAAAAQAQVTAAQAQVTTAQERATQAELALRNRVTDRGAPPPSNLVPGMAPGIAEDASSGRGWVMPTALTAPAGTWTLSAFELFVISGSYAATDRLTITVGGTLPITDERAAGLSAKLQLFRSGHLRIAAQSSLTYAWTRDGSDDATTLGSAGGVATLCIDAACRSHLSSYLGAGFTHHGDTSGVYVGAGSLTLALGSHTKAVFELENGAGAELARGSLGWYGVRFHWTTLALDLGLATPLGAATNMLGTSPLPFLGLTYRSPASQERS